MKNIWIWYKKHGKNPKYMLIRNNLETIQKLTGGYVEVVELAENLCCICNEEGLLYGLPYNCEICGYHFVGDIIIAGVDGEEFANCPLKTRKEMEKLFPQLWKEE